jgi:hypothetical protein
MAMIVLSSPATLTGAEEKKTGPSRFIADFLTELTKLSKFRIYKRAYNRFTRSLQQVYTNQTRIAHSVYTQNTPSEQPVYTEYTLSEQVVRRPIPLPPLKFAALRLSASGLRRGACLPLDPPQPCARWMRGLGRRPTGNMPPPPKNMKIDCPLLPLTEINCR